MGYQFFYGSDNLTVKKAISLAEGGTDGVLSEEVRQRINASQQYIQQMVEAGIVKNFFYDLQRIIQFYANDFARHEITHLHAETPGIFR